MKTQKIEDMKLKDILDILLGERYAQKVLAKVQEAIDSGMDEQKFNEFVNKTIDEISNLQKEAAKTAACLIKLTLPTHRP